MSRSNGLPNRSAALCIFDQFLGISDGSVKLPEHAPQRLKLAFGFSEVVVLELGRHVEP